MWQIQCIGSTFSVAQARSHNTLYLHRLVRYHDSQFSLLIKMIVAKSVHTS